MTEVIYIIRCLKNNNFYIGHTKNFDKRKKSHISTLKNNRHSSKLLQKDFNCYKIENFIFCQLLNGKNLKQQETKFIEILNPIYNNSRTVEFSINTELEIIKKQLDILILKKEESIKIDNVKNANFTEVETTSAKKVLKLKIYEKFGNLTNFAKISGIKQSSLSRMFNSEARMNVSTINCMLNFLKDKN